MKYRLPFALIFAFFPGGVFPSDPLPPFNRLGLSSPAYQASQGWVLNPMDFELLPGYAPVLTTPTFEVGGTPDGLGAQGGGGILWGSFRFSLYGYGRALRERVTMSTLTLRQTLSEAGIAQSLQRSELPGELPRSEAYGVRLGIAQDRWGLGVGYQRSDQTLFPNAFSWSFPDTEVVAEAGSFFTLISSPTQGRVEERLTARGSSRTRYEELFLEAGLQLGPLFALVAVAAPTRTLLDEGRIENPVSGYTTDWNKNERARALSLNFALARVLAEPEGVLFGIGGGYDLPREFSHTEGVFFTGRVPPFTREEWAREWEVEERRYQSFGIQGLLGYYDYQPPLEFAGGIYGRTVRLRDERTLLERLRLRRVGEGSFGTGESANLWESREDFAQDLVGAGGGGRVEILPGFFLLQGASLEVQKEQGRSSLSPLSLRPVTGVEGREGGVLDPLFLPYAPKTIELGGDEHSVAFLLRIALGFELRFRTLGRLGIYWLRDSSGSQRFLAEWVWGY